MMQLTISRSLLSILTLAVTLVLSESNKTIPNKSYTTSMPDKLELLDQNRKLIFNLNDYVDKLQEKADTLRRLAQELEKPLKAANGREKEFLSNPLHIYSLIRHMHQDWPHLESFMMQTVGQEQIDYIKEMRDKLPRIEDVGDATAAMYRVQKVFSLDPADLAKGLLDGVQYDAKLSLLDCYEIGKHYFQVAELKDASNWLFTARDIMNHSPADIYMHLNVSRSNISSFLARSLAAEGNLEQARGVLMDEPELSSRAEELIANYMKYVEPEMVNDPFIDTIEGKFIQLCDSSHKPKPTRLLCSYKSTPSEFLRLAPFKMEQLSVDPYIVVFHDAIYDSEIVDINRIGEPMLARTSVRDNNSNISTVSKIRTASGAWISSMNLTSPDMELVHRILRRVKDMSGLVVESALGTEMQLLHYVFGGYYKPHRDYFNRSIGFEDRIATVLFYLNDMTRGGGTVFPDLELVVQPERGKALHFYNMVPGTYDYEPRSLHGACPVLMGKKKVMTNWIYEWDQMFIKPCLHPPVSRLYA